VSLPDDPPSVVATPLGVEELVLVGRPDRLPSGRGSLTLDRIAAASFVDFPGGWGVRTIIDRAFAAADLHRDVTIEVADVATLIRLVGAGLGVAVLPRSLLGAGDPAIRTRSLTPAPSWCAVMAVPADRPVSAAARALAELVTVSSSGPTAHT
jgi:DNA-binding transcriptional LysR family regulator